MRTKNTLTVTAIATFMFAGFSAANAEVLTPEQALSRVSTEKVPTQIKTLSKSSPILAYTQSAEGQATVYLFNEDNEYLVVSADDVAPALLGYGDNFNGINPTLQWWISEYGRQIEWARNAGIPSALNASASTSTDNPAIEPMTTTRWNQDAPFNDDCPTVNGTHCVTGCVATALSQVMKYHNWPAKGTGSNSYTSSTIGKTLSVNFANTTYDWDNMVNIYDGSASQAEKNAVATLMYSAGVAVDMDYTTSESSATSFAAAQAMINYFNYDKGIMFYSRDYYTIDAWNDLVYNQLKNYGPVQYSGQSNQGGHSFVCDGYSSDGYFHINWGWGGMSDGYFLLTALNPTSQGIGGSTSGYNFEQDIIGNVKPADGTTSTVKPNFVAQQFVVSSNQVSLSQQVAFEGPVYSYSLANVSGNYGVKVTDASGNVTYLKGSAFNNLAPEYGVQAYYVTLPSTLAEGTYSVAPAVSDSEGNWYDVPVLVGSSKIESMTVSNDVATFTTTAAATVSVSDVSVNTEFYIGSQYELTATITNNGTQEYLGGVRLMLINSENEAIAEGDEYPVDLQGGESSDITYLSSWTAANNTTLSAGQYYICFVDENGDQLSDMQTITLNAQSTPSMTVSNFTVVGDANDIDPANLEFTAELSCTSGYFGGTLSVVIFPYTSGEVTSVASYSTDPIFLSSGNSTDIDVKADFSNASEGSTYFAMIYNGSSPVSNSQVVFKVGNTSGVKDIEGTNTVTDTKYYTLDGVQVKSDSLVPGLYISQKTMSDGSVVTEKSLVR